MSKNKPRLQLESIGYTNGITNVFIFLLPPDDTNLPTKIGF